MERQESVDQYAKKINLPPTKTLDLGGGVQMELVLIPAGKFVMGTPATKIHRHEDEERTGSWAAIVFALGRLAMVIRFFGPTNFPFPRPSI